MNDQLTGALRQTFEEIADAGGPPPLLARAALTAARRRRRAQTGAGVALALCAVLTAAGVAVGGDRGAPTASGSSGGSVIAAYSGVRDLTVEDGSPAFNYSMLLDRKTGTYQRQPYRTMIPSPDGDRVLVGTGDNSSTYPTRVGIMDRETGVVRWTKADQVPEGFPGNADDGVWSPDGQRILFRFNPKTDLSGVVVLDAETLHAEFAPIAPYVSVGDNSLAWTPDGAGFALVEARAPGESNAYVASGVRFFGLDGRPGRTLDVPDPDLWATPDFSPGGQMALSGPAFDDRPLSIVLVDPDTGAIGARITLGERGQVIGWPDEAHLLVRTFDGRDAEHLEVIDLTGKVTKRLVPAAAGEICISSAAGLPRSAADLIF